MLPVGPDHQGFSERKLDTRASVAGYLAPKVDRFIDAPSDAQGLSLQI